MKADKSFSEDQIILQVRQSYKDKQHATCHPYKKLLKEFNEI
jgi:hypothetical protein